MQLRASKGLRNTRATARHADVSDAEVSAGETSNVSEPEFLRKTHLALKQASTICPLPLYLYAQCSGVASA